MENNTKAEHLKIKSNYRKLGLLYGIIVGVAYSLSTWGFDAYTLYRVDASLPWLKISIGLLFCVFVGGIAGLLVGSQDRGIVAVILWVLAGVSFAWITGHLPFDISSAAIGLLDPQFKGLEVYPLYESTGVRLTILLLVTGALGGISGALQLVILDSARSASTRLGQFFILFLGIPFFVLAGFMNDGQINQITRDPLIAVDKLVNFALEHQGETIDPQVALDMHYGSLRKIEDVLVQPQSIMLSDYDQTSMLSTSVELDLNRTWARCNVVNKQVTMCWPTLQLYQEGLVCIVNQEERCRINPSEEALAWLDLYGDRLGDVPEISIEASRGMVLFMNIEIESGEQFLCRFREAQPIYFEGCEPKN
jgi:hypothetical protein